MLLTLIKFFYPAVLLNWSEGVLFKSKSDSNVSCNSIPRFILKGWLTLLRILCTIFYVIDTPNQSMQNP